MLSTSENSAESGTFYGDTARYCDDECMMYEVDLNAAPHNKWYTLRMPLKDFVTVYDGMKNGDKQEAYQLEVIENVLTVNFSDYLDLKSEYHILLSNELTNSGGGKLAENVLFGFSTVSQDCWTGDLGIYTSGGSFTDMASSAEVFAKTGYVNSSSKKKLY